jgi:hypothetical protein
LLYQLAEAQMLAGDPANARMALSQALVLAPQHGPSLRLQTQLDAERQSMSAFAGRPVPPPN